MKKLILSLLTALTLAPAASPMGCGSSMEACTELGCSDLVSFKVSHTLTYFQGKLPATVRACVGTACTDATIDVDAQGKGTCKTDQPIDCTFDSQGVLDIGVDISSGPTPQTKIDIVGKDGSTTFAAEGTADIKEVFPNGEDCPSACKQGTEIFDAK